MGASRTRKSRMKNTLKFILIAILAFSSLKANAVVYSGTQVKSIIAKQVVEIYKNYTDAQLSVQVVALPFGELDLPDGHVTFVVKPSVNKFMARDLEKVSVYVNNQFVKTFNAPVVVKAYEDVLVTAGFINIGQRVSSSNVTVKRLEISNTMGYQLKSDMLDKEIISKKAFREGEMLDKRFVKYKPDISRNDVVTVLFNKDNLTVSTEATALSDGVVGDTICLMNKNYNKTYQGKVIGENKVLVKI